MSYSATAQSPHTRAPRLRGHHGRVREELTAGVILRLGRSAFGANRKTLAHAEPHRFRFRSSRQRHPALIERQDCTLVVWYRSLYAPRTGGAYDSHHRTAEIAGFTRRRGGRVAARGARAAAGDASDWMAQFRIA